MLYLTRPVVLHPRGESTGRDDRFDFFLANAEIASGRRSDVGAWFEPLRDGLIEIETCGAAALRMALAGRDGVPSILFDCRSSPALDCPAASYKLGAKAGLRTTPPVMLTGQGGIEALQAMQFFARSAKPGFGALVTVSGVAEANEGGAPKPLFASACLLGRTSLGVDEIYIHSVLLARGGGPAAATIDAIVAEAMQESGLVEPAWVAVSPRGEALASWSRRFPETAVLQRRNDSGSVSLYPDPLLALDGYGAAIPDGEPGLLVCLGATGAVGVAVLSMHRGRKGDAHDG